MTDKILKLYINSTGQKIKTSGNFTISQYSTNNELHLITIGEFASITATFRDPAGNLSTLYHFVLNGKYELEEDDVEAVLTENADNLYEYVLPIPKKASSITVSGSSARLSVSFAGYVYDPVSYILKQSMTAATQIMVNKADSATEFDEGYNAVDVENLWIAVNKNSAHEVQQDEELADHESRIGDLEEDNESNKDRLTELEQDVSDISTEVSGIVYTAGYGLQKENMEFSIDRTVVATKSDIPVIADNLTTNDSSKVLSAKQGKILKDKIDGVSRAYVFNNISDMVSGLKAISNTTDYRAGDDIFIKAMNVPDFWIYAISNTYVDYDYIGDNAFLRDLKQHNGVLTIGKFTISLLETEKVDLTEYQKKSEVLNNLSDTNITYTMSDNSETSFIADDITNLNLIIPSTIKHGWYGAVNFKSSSSAPIFTITNNSSYPLKLYKYGFPINYFAPIPNTMVDMLCYNDGVYTYLLISEA